MPKVCGAGQGCPLISPAVTTATAAAMAIKTFIQHATALRRTQLLELLSPFSHLTKHLIWHPPVH